MVDKEKDKNHPDFFPHLVTEKVEKWKVEYRHAGHTIDTKKRVVGVPAAGSRDLSEQERQIRLFQLARAKHSPVESLNPARDGTDLFRLMLEEQRISSVMREQYGIDVSHRYDNVLGQLRDEIPSMERKDLAAAHLLLQSMDGSDEADRIRDEVWDVLNPTSAERRMLDEASDVMTGLGSLPDYKVEGAVRIREQLADRLLSTFAPPPPPSKMIERLTGTGEFEGKFDMPGPGDPSYGKAEEASDPAFKEGPLKPIPGGWGDAPSIGNMRIHDHITRRRKSFAVRLPKGAREWGVVPVNWHRFCTDAAIFQGRRKGGAVVIDCSGSMAWDWDYLKNQILSLPALRVGNYNGTDSQSRTGINGTLCVVAKDGRWSEYDCSNSGGNGVDYEALLWVASQKKPRVWVSDGQVCGGNWGHDRSLLGRMCVDVMKKYEIWRVPTMEEAIRYIKTRRIPATAVQTVPRG